MTKLNSRGVLDRWQIVQRATIPGAECENWQVDGVDWRRQRHAFAGGGYSFAVEIHRLACARPGKSSWSLMVVVEHWWGADKEVLKTASWARRLSGSSASIFAWVRDHEAVRRAMGRPS
jgi:hypothetical protein